MWWCHLSGYGSTYNHCNQLHTSMLRMIVSFRYRGCEFFHKVDKMLELQQGVITLSPYPTKKPTRNL